MNELSSESQSSIQNFEFINKVSIIHSNFSEIMEIYENIKSLHEKITYINQLIDEDLDEEGRVSLDSPMPNLLQAHYHLSQLSDFRDKLIQLAQLSASDDVKRTIQKHFQALEPVNEKFERSLFEDISDGLLEFYRENNQSLIIRTVKIIDYEERHDLENMLINKIYAEHEKQVSRSNVYDPKKDRNNLLQKLSTNEPNKENSKTTSFRNRSLISFRLKPRNYKAKMISAIAKSVAATFENCISTFSDPLELLQNLDWVFADLIFVKQELVKCFPSDGSWNIFVIYFDIYHTGVQKLIGDVISESSGETGADTTVITAIIDFDKKYSNILKNQLKVEDKNLLEAETKTKLLDDYLKLLVSNMKQWIGQLAATEYPEFKARRREPEVEHDKTISLGGTVIVFRMFNQQVDVALDSGQGKIVDGTIGYFSELLRDRQKKWSQTLTDEVERQLTYDLLMLEREKKKDNDDPPEAVPPGLLEYIVAFGNDQIKAADYTTSLQSKISELVSKKYKTSIVDNLTKVTDGFVDLVTECINQVIKIILTDVNETLKTVFTKKWYNNGTTSIVLVWETLTEYMNDFKSIMNPSIFDIFVEFLLDNAIIGYLSGLKEHHTFKGEDKTIAIIKQNLGKLYENFSEFMESDMIQTKFKIFEHLIEFIENNDSDDIVLQRFGEVRVDFPDCPLSFLNDVLNCKKHFDSKRVSSILGRVPRIDLDNEFATFMAKY